MITPTKLPYIAERFLGVTIPEDSVMFACSYEGLHKIFLEDPVRIETDGERGEDYEALKAKGEAIGLFGGVPIHADAHTKISYFFDSRASEQRVELIVDGEREIITFATLSGDWFFASLSKCGKFLLLAEPYAIEVYRVA